MLPNSFLLNEKNSWIYSGKIFWCTGKYYNITPDLRLVSSFFFVKLFAMSQDFENLVAHFTNEQHCCWIFQCLV